MPHLDTAQNTGFIPSSPSPTDWMASAETGITLGALNPSGDWKPYLPNNERQLLVLSTKQYGTQTYLETNSCVTFSATNVLETGANFAMQKSLWPTEAVEWLRGPHIIGGKEYSYLDADGKLNLSDRFTAKMSGTDPMRGNQLQKVWDSLRHDGAVPEALWPMPVDTVKQWVESGKQFTLSELQSLYFAAIPREVVDLGKEFAKRFGVLYDWVSFPGSAVDRGQFAEKLKTTPIQIATAVCKPWNTSEIINACGPGGQHATALVCIPVGWDEIYDHYVPFLKRFAPDYSLTYAMRGVLVPKAPGHYVFAKDLIVGAPNSSEVKELQKALQLLKDKQGQPYMKPGLFGAYGKQTQDAVARFQVEVGIVDGPPGTHFGPKTRAAMNARLAALTDQHVDYKSDSQKGVGSLINSIMDYIRKALQWTFVSSADPEKISATLKFALLGAIPVIMQAIGLACGFNVLCLDTNAGELEQVGSAVANVVYFAVSAVAAGGTVLAFLRKVVRTARGTNAGMGNLR